MSKDFHRAMSAIGGKMRSSYSPYVAFQDWVESSDIDIDMGLHVVFRALPFNSFCEGYGCGYVEGLFDVVLAHEGSEMASELNRHHERAFEAGRVYASQPERDPTGRNPHDPGAKLDAGKPRAGLVLSGFPRALAEVSKVGTYGAEKYSDNGWMDVPDGEQRYTDAMMRHLLAEWRGEKRDADTDLHHAAHAAWNALARLELMLRGES